MILAHESLSQDFKNAEKFLEEKKPSALARLIDSTSLKVDVTQDQIKSLCKEAATLSFRSVCVPPSFVKLASLELIHAKNVLVCTVVGFPNGYAKEFVKIFEVEEAIKDGAKEIDYVQNMGFVKDGRWEELTKECKSIIDAASGNLVKVILETSLLTSSEIRKCSEVLANAGVHVIKTSTGFGQRGATQEDLKLIQGGLSEVLKGGVRFGVKASGGVRSVDDAIAFVELGATRIGTSGGAKLIAGLKNLESY